MTLVTFKIQTVPRLLDFFFVRPERGQCHSALRTVPMCHPRPNGDCRQSNAATFDITKVEEERERRKRRKWADLLRSSR
ncbi:hypothetical protein L596_011083 [Steinernema carpocapsae]|uniref:Uncharacterized protein n=1 Tax=Steinernema carpocapsae TaxID=34508 RepID=A0A4U5NS36_STECR|nr:hypothetical protein L596_011083 [Steinernema carpocapsae]